MPASVFRKGSFWVPLLGVAVIAGILSTFAGRDLAGNWLRTLRVEKVQAVNLDLSPFVGANANPALHQIVSQMISDKVDVTLNEPNQPVAERAAAATTAGFPIQLPDARKDTPKLIVDVTSSR